MRPDKSKHANPLWFLCCIQSTHPCEIREQMMLALNSLVSNHLVFKPILKQHLISSERSGLLSLALQGTDCRLMLYLCHVINALTKFIPRARHIKASILFRKDYDQIGKGQLEYSHISYQC